MQPRRSNDDGLRGNGTFVAEHDSLIAAVAAEYRKCDALVLGQFSMARAASGIAAAPGRKVFTSPQSAVNRLKQMFDAH